jgi:hypothetical protein
VQDGRGGELDSGAPPFSLRFLDGIPPWRLTLGRRVPCRPDHAMAFFSLAGMTEEELAAI